MLRKCSLAERPRRKVGYTTTQSHNFTGQWYLVILWDLFVSKICVCVCVCYTRVHAPMSTIGYWGWKRV